MASRGIVSMLSEDFLSCEVCQEHFDTDARTPRILPCYHTFCGSCLRQMGQDGHLTCPKCRVSMKVEAAFPTDTTRVQLLDLVKARDKEGQACQGCESGAMAISRCQECEEFLCANCTSAHRMVKLTRSHKLENLSEAALPPAVQKATTPTKDPELCSEHQDEKLKWFCGKCKKTACSTCVITMHKGCPNVVELSSIVDKKKKKVLALGEKLSGLGQTFKQTAEDLEASSEAVDQRLQEGIEQAEQTFSAIVATAMERQADVIQELRMAAKADRLSLEQEAAHFRSLQAAAEASAEKGKQVVSLEQAARISEQECQMKKTAAELGKKTTASVKPASTFQVWEDHLDEMKTVIKSILEQTFEEQEITHVGIRCDGCDRRVAGTRYACLQCPDYDLCDSCEAIGEHHPHSMLKLTRPVSMEAVATLREKFVELRPPVAKHFNHKPHSSVDCDGCGDEPVCGVLYKCLDCRHNYDLCENCEATEYHPHHIMLKLVCPWSWKKVKAFMEEFRDLDL